MTDDFITLSDAELDQVSGGTIIIPTPPHHTGHHTPGWHHAPEPKISAITPFRNLDFYLGG